MVMDFNAHFKLILASKSPRRAQLLRESGFEFETEVIDTDESYPDDLPLLEIAEFVAIKKSKAYSHLLKPKTIILTSDTTVLLDDTHFEKPADKPEAIEMLRQLSGQTHIVNTGVCLLSSETIKSFNVVSKVTLDHLSMEEINYYIDTCQPYDKAGGYGIQEWLGHCKISKMEGSYTNIMGLPVREVYQHLQTFLA